MLASKYYLSTKKEVPSDAETISHILMLRSGMIKRLASGLYTWMPLGLKVLKKVEKIVREEMNASGCHEVLMPAIQPAELWKETDRWDKFGPLLLKIKDRNEREYCYGPTHEEIITDIVRKDLTSYKQLPFVLYQIQTKFRDEIRPRFGVMRAREFLMKDAYSFHDSQESLNLTYDTMLQTYHKIFKRLGLNVRSVLADTGSIGGQQSHEFQVLADSGEDLICYSDQSSYAANIEFAKTLEPALLSNSQTLNDKPVKFSTDNIFSLEGLSKKFNIPLTQMVKCVYVKGTVDEIIMLILRADHTLNEVKAIKHPLVANPLTFIQDLTVSKLFNCPSFFIGPIQDKLKIIVDLSALSLNNFICGANEPKQFYKNVNWNREILNYETFDIRNVIEGDPSPDGKGFLKIQRGIEVGHIFQLGDVYSKSMKVTYTDMNGKKHIPLMGCYGIGISRIVAAAIEQHHDEKGIIWSKELSPFQIIIIPLDLHKNPKNLKNFMEIFDQLLNISPEVLLDDRDLSPGIKFADADLIGIPHRIVISNKLIEQNQFEYKNRAKNEIKLLQLDSLLNFASIHLQP